MEEQENCDNFLKMIWKIGSQWSWAMIKTKKKFPNIWLIRSSNIPCWLMFFINLKKKRIRARFFDFKFLAILGLLQLWEFAIFWSIFSCKVSFPMFLGVVSHNLTSDFMKSYLFTINHHIRVCDLSILKVVHKIHLINNFMCQEKIFWHQKPS